MKISELLNNKLIICFKEDRNIFLNLKKKDPFLNFKLMDVNEVIERLSFSYDYKALVEIIHTKKVNIKAARQIINCLRFVDESNDFETVLGVTPEVKHPRNSKHDDISEQLGLPLDAKSRGIMENTTPTLINNEDMDIPTFQRKQIKIDSGK